MKTFLIILEIVTAIMAVYGWCKYLKLSIAYERLNQSWCENIQNAQMEIIESSDRSFSFGYVAGCLVMLGIFLYLRWKGRLR